jgi:hypothetical protein
VIHPSNEIDDMCMISRRSGKGWQSGFASKCMEKGKKHIASNGTEFSIGNFC